MSKWISVKDRLPDQQVNVLICGKQFSDDAEIGWQYGGDFYIDEPVIAFDGYEKVTGVTHWMPLPEPPEQESER